MSSHSTATVGSGSIVNDVQWGYNDFNQITSEAQAHEGAVNSGTPMAQYSYADGSSLTVRRTGITYPDGRIIGTGYGSDGDLDDLNNRIAFYTEWGTPLVTYLRRGISAVVQLQYLEPSIELSYVRQSGSGELYPSLDRFGRVVDIPWRQAGNIVDRYQYGFDLGSNRKYRKNLTASGNPTGNDWDEYYTYDGLDQLQDLRRGTLNGNHSGITGTPTWEEALTFDPTGNWINYLTKSGGSTSLNQNRTHNAANEIATIASSAATVGYDPAGNMSTMPLVNKYNWSIPQNLKWDAWNRLVAITHDSSTSTFGLYQYDGLFRRISKYSHEETLHGHDWQTRHFYYSDQWQVLEERLGGDAFPARQFVWGARYRDDLILRDRMDQPLNPVSSSSSSEAPDDTRLYVTHDQWHVTAVLSPEGAVFERYAYDAFGFSIILTPEYYPRYDVSACAWETRFGAYRFDPESGLYQVRFRYLHSQLGRWMSRDPIEERGGINVYGYVGNDPTKWIDQLGLEAMRPISGALPNNSRAGTPGAQRNRNCVAAAAGVDGVIGMPQDYKPKPKVTIDEFIDEIKKHLDPSGGTMKCRQVSCDHIQTRDVNPDTGKPRITNRRGAQLTPCECKEREVVVFPYADANGAPDVHAVGREAPCPTYVPYESNVSGIEYGDITDPRAHVRDIIKPSILFDPICFCCNRKHAE